VIRAASARAPVRLDFSGGWTDVPPFSAREDGVVVSGAISLYARATAAPRAAGLRLSSEDLGDTLELPGAAPPLLDGRLDLLKAAVRLLAPDTPLALTTSADVPLGSGLGSSGALDVAMVGALTAATGSTLDPRACAECAWRLEAIEARIQGGKQDQFSAALGGINLFRFRDPGVTVEPLAIDADAAAELERRIVLCYTGASRFSGATIGRVMAAYERGVPGVVSALRGIRDVACEMAEAVPAGDFARIGRLLAENWRQQQALDPAMCTPAMAELEAAARAAGALGGKAAGSGAGGCKLFMAGDDVGAVRDAATSLGMRLLPVRWDREGVRAC
jgi:D-glycero-alpha-D-manno-heptose-7-phosphate kinase